MAVDYRFSVPAGSDLGERHHILVPPHERLVFSHGPDAKITVTIVGVLHFHVWGRALKEWRVGGDAGLVTVISQFAVQDRRMGSVDPALQCLEPVTFLPHLGHVAVCVWDLGQLELGRSRFLVGRAEIGPNHAAHIQGWVSGDLDPFFELSRLVHLIDAVAVHIELPAVVHATDPALFVAPEIKASPAVGTALLDQTDAAIGAAEGH